MSGTPLPDAARWYTKWIPSQVKWLNALSLSHEWRPGIGGAFRLGLHHGTFCAACCWALMVIQMILGVMNLEVMIVIAAIIGTEKLWRRGPALARVVGVCTIAAGVALIVKSVR